MKTERAIELLNRISDSQFDGVHGDERREALEMAVRVLEGDGDTISRQQAIAIVRHRCKRCTTEAVLAITEIEQLPPVQPTQTNADSTQSNALDYVSRQAAIDAVNKLVEWYKEKWHESRPTSESVIDVLNDLPSAQPQWIPCSERLPDYGEVVLWCNKHGSVFTSAITYQSVDYISVGKHGGSGTVIAWMPLPEPYGGESDKK